MLLSCRGPLAPSVHSQSVGRHNNIWGGGGRGETDVQLGSLQTVHLTDCQAFWADPILLGLGFLFICVHYI